MVMHQISQSGLFFEACHNVKVFEASGLETSIKFQRVSYRSLGLEIYVLRLLYNPFYDVFVDAEHTTELLCFISGLNKIVIEYKSLWSITTWNFLHVLCKINNINSIYAFEI